MLSFISRLTAHPSINEKEVLKMFGLKRSRSKRKIPIFKRLFRFFRPEKPKPVERKPKPKPKPVERKPKPKRVCDLGEDYYTTKEVADALKLSVSALGEYRRKGTGPKYTVVSYRSYRYSKAEVMRYLQEMTRASTSATRNYDLHP